MNMFKKLSDEEMEQLDALLDRAVYNRQFSIGAPVGDTDVESGLSGFHLVDEVSGTYAYDGECVGVTLSYDGLKWLFKSAQEARRVAA